MPYYAHVRQDESGENIYQTVAEHLTGTATLCLEFAADFGAEVDGELTGLTRMISANALTHSRSACLKAALLSTTPRRGCSPV